LQTDAILQRRRKIRRQSREKLVVSRDVLQSKITAVSIEITRDTRSGGKRWISEVWRTVREASSLTANHCHSPGRRSRVGRVKKEKKKRAADVEGRF